jgi:hypothetical protein
MLFVSFLSTAGRQSNRVGQEDETRAKARQRCQRLNIIIVQSTAKRIHQAADNCAIQES